MGGTERSAESMTGREGGTGRGKVQVGGRYR